MINRLNAARLKPYFEQCGYRSSLIESNVQLADNRYAALAAFAHAPCDSRSACIAAIDGFVDPLQDAVACRPLGTPVNFVCFHDRLEWWVQASAKTERREIIPTAHLDNFFDQHSKEFGPEAIYRAKTWGRFEQGCQLEFVDLGLMPLVEAEAGRKLQSIMEGAVTGTKSRLGWRDISEEQGHWLLKSNFWLLAAKILKDKEVSAFADLNLQEVTEVFKRLAKHYGAATPVPVNSKRQAEALRETARQISSFSHLGLVSTEALAYLYENALISKETRAQLGTHSTPSYLVDYIVGKLRSWIEETPVENHYVFEPACGHSAFLLAAMRVLGELLSTKPLTPSARHEFLRQRLHGCDIDPFALEIARLSLTLADVPNPNGWHLEATDMFSGGLLADQSRRATLVLANPPFENFTAEERNGFAGVQHVNKTAEMLWRVVKNARPGMLLGVVLPQGLLHSEDATRLRQTIAENFEIAEICLFPDKVFTFSDAESSVILARRLPDGKKGAHLINYRRIREPDVESFKWDYQATTEHEVSPSRFSSDNGWNFFVPDLENVWEFCRSYPKFDSVADVGQGFSFVSPANLPKGAITETDHRRKGLVRGFVRLREDLQTHQLPDKQWVNLDPKVILVARHGTKKGVSQVLLNYARVSRGPWRLKAFINKQGHPVTSQFLAIRPKDKRWKLELLWAIGNSPFANAYSYAFSGKRDVLAGLIRDMPIPPIDGKDVAPLLKAVRVYLKAVRTVEDSLVTPAYLEKLKVLHWRIDAEVLRLYDLPPQLEKQVLDLFCGIERRGVPFQQKEYLPETFVAPLTLHDLLAVTEDWGRTNVRRARLILKEERKRLLPEEKAELTRLQQLADARMDLLAPLPLKELEGFTSELKRKGLWVSE